MTASPDPAPDTLLDGRITFHQPQGGYRAAIDPILLASACPPGQGRAIELGAGAGAASLALAHRCPDVPVTAIERDPAIFPFLERNVAANGLEGRLTPLQADIRTVTAEEAGGPAALVLANPPYLQAGRYTESEDPARLAANSEGDTPLEDWIAAARRLSAPKAALVIIHRTDRLADLLAALRPAYGAIEVIPLWPAQGKPARRIILRARFGSGAPLSLYPGLVLHQPGGDYSDAADAILRGGRPFDAAMD